MVYRVEAITWRPTGQTATRDYIALIAVDAAVDPEWIIEISRNVQSSDRQISPRWLTIDNFDNPNFVQIAFGPVAFSVSPFKRQVFPLPPGTEFLRISVIQFVTNIYLSESKICETEDNDYKIALAATPSTTGMTAFFAMATAPNSWLVCDGGEHMRSAFPDLFLAIGTIFGAGDGVHTFNVPNGDDLVLRGWANGRGLYPARAFGVVQQDAFKSHKHTDQGHSHTDAGHLHLDGGHTHVDSGHAHSSRPVFGTLGLQPGTGAFTVAIGEVSTTANAANIQTNYSNIQINYAAILTNYSNLTFEGDTIETRVKNLGLLMCIKT